MLSTAYEKRHFFLLFEQLVPRSSQLWRDILLLDRATGEKVSAGSQAELVLMYLWFQHREESRKKKLQCDFPPLFPSLFLHTFIHPSVHLISHPSIWPASQPLTHRRKHTHTIRYRCPCGRVLVLFVMRWQSLFNQVSPWKSLQKTARFVSDFRTTLMTKPSRWKVWQM